ncbi:MAG: hypothetical protein GF364_09530 [Candidatus Lokiarchaeota archaeon]|nr:hypothetical protein [Candidatus Lokiarchaeota archaeon]
MSSCFIFKILVVGPHNSKKTWFLNKSLNIRPIVDTHISIGVDFALLNMEFDEAEYHLQFWDFKDIPRFRFMYESYCLGGRGCLLFTNFNQLGNIYDLTFWIDLVRLNAGNIPIMLCVTNYTEKFEWISEFIQEFVEEQDLIGYHLLQNDTSQQDTHQVLMELIREIHRMVPPKRTRKDLSDEEKQYLEKFLALFSTCPVCGGKNHLNYIRNFFFSTNPQRAEIRETIVNLLEKMDNNRLKNLRIGIPCCSCFNKIFKKTDRT